MRHVDSPRDRVFVGRRFSAIAAANAANELRFCLRTDPKTFNPLLVEDESSSAVRYLTGGVLIRLNRYTQELEGELATKWKVSENGRRIDFDLRTGVRFSDGTPFTCEDVAYTMHQLMDPALHSPVGDAFRSAPGEVETKCTGAVLGDGALPRPGGGSGRAIRSEWPSCPRIRLRKNPPYWVLLSWVNISPAPTSCCGVIPIIGNTMPTDTRSRIWIPSGSISSRIANWSCCVSGAANST